jgi:hypothetical protein
MSSSSAAPSWTSRPPHGAADDSPTRAARATRRDRRGTIDALTQRATLTSGSGTSRPVRADS